MNDLDVSDSPRRRRPEPEIARPWLITFTSVFLSVLLANLLSYLIAYQVVRAYVNHKMQEFGREMEKSLKDLEKRH